MRRIVRGSPGMLTATFYLDDAPVDLDADPLVSIRQPDGDPVVIDAPTVRTDDGTYAYELVAQSGVMALSCEWTGLRGGMPVQTWTYAEIVGAEYFSLAELRKFDSVLQSTTKYPDAKLRAARLSVETEFEGICGRSFVPRYAQETLTGDGSGRVWLSNPDPIRLISLSVDGEAWVGASLRRPTDNLRVLDLDSGVFARGAPIAIEYEYGFREVPIRIKHAALKRAKYSLVADVSRIDERATTMNIPDFGNFVLATPGMRGSYTGIPEVDVVLADYAIGTL